MAFLNFNEIEDTGKTKKFQVCSGTNELAIIKWYAPWRRYAFFPKGNALFDSSCLKEITVFIDELMDERKLK